MMVKEELLTKVSSDDASGGGTTASMITVDGLDCLDCFGLSRGGGEGEKGSEEGIHRCECKVAG